jgi:hypothetical protein
MAIIACWCAGRRRRAITWLYYILLVLSLLGTGAYSDRLQVRTENISIRDSGTVLSLRLVQPLKSRLFYDGEAATSGRFRNSSAGRAAISFSLGVSSTFSKRCGSGAMCRVPQVRPCLPALETRTSKRPPLQPYAPVIRGTSAMMCRVCASASTTQSGAVRLSPSPSCAFWKRWRPSGSHAMKVAYFHAAGKSWRESITGRSSGPTVVDQIR